ncbi:MAG: YitT family protein [Erysipelotrichales bacterium]|nr:YitT family protein [Erysipelotrichales bacterium]
MKKLKTIFLIVLGNMILAFGVTAFMIPHNIIIGGSTGIASFINYYFDIPLSYTVMTINVIMFFVGYFMLGKKFALTTIISTFVYPLFLEVFQSIDALSHFCDDLFLAGIYAGIIIGIGIGLVIKAGASTGGMDIPLILLNKKKGIPVGNSMYICDTLILLTQMTFSKTTEILYGILIVFVTSFIINKVLTAGVSQIQMFIVSPKYEEIKHELIYNLDNGVTLVNVETGMNELSQKAVMAVMSNRKLNKVKQSVLDIDKQAFITVTQIHEVSGRGFSFDRYVD